MSRDAIEAFLQDMKARYGEQIEGVELPDGARDYVEERVAQGDVDTLLFMMKLGYLLGVQTGFAAGRSGDEPPSGSGPMGSIQA